MKQKFIDYFMSVAELTANLSHAKKLKVGSVIVKDDRIISCGYNGLPAGWNSNICEKVSFLSDAEYFNSTTEEKQKYTPIDGIYFWKGLKTYDEVIHSEANSISRLASSTESGVGAIMFCTHSPCIQCSKIIYSAGIKTVYYKHEYRSTEGIKFLKMCGVEIIKYIDERANV